jgi:hypothetical protein
MAEKMSVERLFSTNRLKITGDMNAGTSLHTQANHACTFSHLSRLIL